MSRHLQMKQEAEQVYTEPADGNRVHPARADLGRAARRSMASSRRSRSSASTGVFFDDTLRAAPHTLSESEEKIVARTGLMADTGKTVYSAFTGAEMPFPKVTLSTGEKVRIDGAGYIEEPRVIGKGRPRCGIQGILHPLRGVRRHARDDAQRSGAVAGVHQGRAQVPERARGGTVPYNIPTSVYTQLIADVHSNLPTLHRYLKLRQKIMGLPQLGYEDLYAPIVRERAVEFHAGGGEAAHARFVRTARPGLRRYAAQGLRVGLGGFPAEHRQELGRL